MQVTVATLLMMGFAYVSWQARRSGSPLAVFICFAIIAIVLLDLVVAVVVTRRVHIAVSLEPTDGVVGDTQTMTVSVTGASSLVHVRVATPMPLAVEPRATGTVSTVALVRGVAATVEAGATSHGLCGLAGFRRRGTSPLPRPVATGPRPVEPVGGFPELWAPGGEENPRAGPGDLVRGVRSYVPGDRPQQVHWRASARLGDLVVKEVEEPQIIELFIVLHLRTAGAAAEDAAGRASWYAAEGLRRRCEVVLGTREEAGSVAGSVRSSSQINWRLAAAVTGDPGLPPGGGRWRRLVLVTDEGDTWS